MEHGNCAASRPVSVYEFSKCYWRRPHEELKGTNKQRKGIELAVIPGGLTSTLQPLKAPPLNKPFKGNVRRLYTEWIASTL